MPHLMILFITLYRSTWLTDDYKKAALSPSLLHLKLSNPFSSYNLFIAESFLFKTSSFIDIILSFYLFNLIVIFDWINKETSAKCLYHHLWIKNETEKTISMAQVHASRTTNYTFGITFIFFPIYIYIYIYIYYIYMCVCRCVCVCVCVHIYLIGFTDPKVVIGARYLSNCKLIDCVQVWVIIFLAIPSSLKYLTSWVYSHSRKSTY